MNKDDIKKALDCCSNPSINPCKDCPYNKNGDFSYCNDKILKDTLNLITEQEKEIEQLKSEIEELSNKKVVFVHISEPEKERIIPEGEPIKDPEIKGPLGKCGNSTLCDCIEKDTVKSFAKNLEEKIFHYLGVENIQQASELSLLDSLLPYDVVIDSIHEFEGECK